MYFLIYLKVLDKSLPCKFQNVIFNSKVLYESQSLMYLNFINLRVLLTTKCLFFVLKKF